MLDETIRLAPDASLYVVECDHRFDAERLPESLSWDVRSYPPAIVAVGEAT